ncbi:IS110 family RNA-guided transposase [Devosia beringensis]|uniref:IS110 family transposase n=1 Tax=Devosia beringensis TaxID=2657486 RepID=UPI00186B86B7|nr:IS110 family transposase [Devosia beringensis]
MIFSPDYVGVDVSKKHLDLAITGSSRLRVSNNPAGMARLVQKISSLTRPHLVCEATGSYTRLMARSLSQHGIALSTINPRRVRDLARADGLLAKTDAIDAAAILRFAHLMHPDPDPLYDPNAVEMADLVRRRRQMVDMLAMEKQRREHPEAALAQASIDAHIGFLSSQIGEMDRAITRQIDSDATLRRRAELLTTIPGIGQTTAAVLLAEMPELGGIGNKQAAALAGVAPFNRDSGEMRGQAHIAGGRLSVRCALYMATLSAIRANPPIRDFYKRLRAQGKPGKLAIVAAMRKLITTANAVLANNTPWHTNTA